MRSWIVAGLIAGVTAGVTSAGRAQSETAAVAEKPSTVPQLQLGADRGTPNPFPNSFETSRPSCRTASRASNPRTPPRPPPRTHPRTGESDSPPSSTPTAPARTPRGPPSWALTMCRSTAGSTTLSIVSPRSATCPPAPRLFVPGRASSVPVCWPRRTTSSTIRATPPPRPLLAALDQEFAHETNLIDGVHHNVGAQAESAYERFTDIAGTPLRDGYNFGQTIVDDYRPSLRPGRKLHHRPLRTRRGRPLLRLPPRRVSIRLRHPRLQRGRAAGHRRLQRPPLRLESPRRNHQPRAHHRGLRRPQPAQLAAQLRPAGPLVGTGQKHLVDPLQQLRGHAHAAPRSRQAHQDAGRLQPARPRASRRLPRPRGRHPLRRTRAHLHPLRQPQSGVESRALSSGPSLPPSSRPKTSRSAWRTPPSSPVTAVH